MKDFIHRDAVGNASFYCGDSLEILRTWEAPPPDVVITSPPYNLDMPYDGTSDQLTPHGYAVWTRVWLGLLWALMAPGGRLLANVPLDTNLGGMRAFYADFMAAARDVGWRARPSIVWHDGQIGKRTAWGSWMAATSPCVTAPVEMICVLHKGDWKRRKGTSTIAREEFMAWTNGHWDGPGAPAKRIGHPAPMPEWMVERLLKLFTFREDVVLDPFGGAGTVAKWALRLGRPSVYIDQSEAYARLAVRRCLDDAVRVPVLCEGDSRTGGRLAITMSPAPVASDAWPLTDARCGSAGPPRPDDPQLGDRAQDSLGPSSESVGGAARAR